MSDEVINQNPEVDGSAHEAVALSSFGQSRGEQVAEEDDALHQDNGADKNAAAGRRQRAEKSEISKEVLAKAKIAVKMFESLSSHGEVDCQIRSEIEQLMSAQKAAMERKLNNEPSQEGEDFDSVSKRLRRANNKLDTHIENRHGLNAAVAEAIKDVMASLEKMLTKVKVIEEEVG